MDLTAVILEQSKQNGEILANQRAVLSKLDEMIEARIARDNAIRRLCSPGTWLDTAGGKILAIGVVLLALANVGVAIDLPALARALAPSVSVSAPME